MYVMHEKCVKLLHAYMPSTHLIQHVQLAATLCRPVPALVLRTICFFDNTFRQQCTQIWQYVNSFRVAVVVLRSTRSAVFWIPIIDLKRHSTIGLKYGFGRASRCHPEYYSTRHCLYVKVSSEADTCLVTPNFVFDSGAATYIMAPDPSSLSWRAPVPSHALRLWILPPCREGSSAVTRPAVSCRSHTSSIKENSRVCKARTHIFKVSNVRVIMGLQYMWVGCTFNACKTCGQAATVRLQCNVGPVDHSR
jgi:hypothetical protein